MSAAEPPAADSSHLQVECYAGYRGEETPRRFSLWDRRFEIDRVLDRWLSPGERYFKVLVGEDDVYILRHDSRRDLWELTLYASRRYLEGGVPTGLDLW